MKNVMIYGFAEGYHPKNKKLVLDVISYQIKISLALGWKPKDIILLSNENIEYYGVKSTFFAYEDIPYKFLYKFMGIKYLFEELKINDVLWYHDWDCYQMDHLEYDLPPKRDIGVYFGAYSRHIRKPNTGTIFIRPSAMDLVDDFISTQIEQKISNDERAVKLVFKKGKNKKRFIDINSRYNVGKTCFNHRYRDAMQPIKCFHFKLHNRGRAQHFLSFIMHQSYTNKNTKKVLEILKEYWAYRNFEYDYEEIATTIQEKLDWVETAKNLSRSEQIRILGEKAQEEKVLRRKRHKERKIKQNESQGKTEKGDEKTKEETRDQNTK